MQLRLGAAQDQDGQCFVMTSIIVPVSITHRQMGLSSMLMMMRIPHGMMQPMSELSKKA